MAEKGKDVLMKEKVPLLGLFVKMGSVKKLSNEMNFDTHD